MSEVTSRSSASRGRGSGRGGRGGFAGRGGRRPNGADKPDHSDSPAAFDDDGDLGELRKLYGDKTSVIREMFPDWSEADVLFALQETNGDQSEAVTRIAEGTISQWGEVSKAKKPARTKAKDAAPAATTTTEQTTAAPRAARGGRAVSEGGRGRGRATERGGRGGAPRGRTAQPPINGASRNKENQQLSVPTEESSAWTETKAKAEPVDTKPASEQSASKPANLAKTWASMLRQSTVPPKPAPVHDQAQASSADSAEPADAPETVPAPALATEEKPKADEETTPVAATADLVIDEPALPPSKDDLTEINLEQSDISSTATPLSAAQRQHQRVPISGYAASALKATTDRTARPPGFQRRVLDQEEAVRMPGNREVDRAAVQFGAFNLGDGDEDVDGEREDAETRGQPPADSPVAQPRTSLPPPVAQPSAAPESFPKAAAPGTGPTAQIPTHPAQPVIPGQQYGRYAQDPSAQKPIDPFGQQATAVSQPPFDSFSSTTTTQTPSQGAFSSAPDYSNYYTANQQERNAYNNYYAQQYSQQQQQAPHGQHDAQQRPLGGYNAAQTDSLSQYPQSGSSHGQPRFGVTADSQNSGHSTPNPASQAQQQIPQGQQAQPGQQGQAGAPGSQPQGHGQQYPGYNHPYYPYYQQYYSGYGQGNFGPYGKGGMYGQPYGMSPNAPYEHASSPGNFAPSNAHRDNAASSGLGDYGRGSASQTGSQPGLGATGFGGSHDSFSRGGSAFQSQTQGFNSQAQPGAGASGADDLKPFGDGKASGPSPSIGGARPGSATNTGPGGQASGLPPPQTSQMGGGYGGYPSHLQGHGGHGSGAYGMGNTGAGANQHGNTPYGSYGNQGFGSGGYYGAGQQQQQRGGWGGNYH
ncbi:hypothetical protein LMH87_002837 [Akanthomyces muscarius]|uniref:RNA polymerase II degradation factor 1 n=1 Tax=Akanthomyces muscarius TaxID=2231603 RepID=A0A9W8Q7V5_AKAMU|nr:hypothetical protein LMH87_002837 [Akanthomyces muscarius]KAJ4148362.1 hypothetical protein LMH87_002837 [Akanthomyces muscarius]